MPENNQNLINVFEVFAEKLEQPPFFPLTLTYITYIAEYLFSTHGKYWAHHYHIWTLTQWTHFDLWHARKPYYLPNLICRRSSGEDFNFNERYRLPRTNTRTRVAVASKRRRHSMSNMHGERQKYALFMWPWSLQRVFRENPSLPYLQDSDSEQNTNLPVTDQKPSCTHASRFQVAGQLCCYAAQSDAKTSEKARNQ